MRLTDESYGVILDLANTSTDLAIMTDFSKNGFTSKDFDRWLDSVSFVSALIALVLIFLLPIFIVVLSIFTLSQLSNL